MKIVKKILVGLGVLFVLFIGLAIYLAGSSSEFERKHQDFVINYTREFSRGWEINSVSAITTNDMLSQINTPNGKHALNVFRTFGEFIEATDIELHNYSTHAGGPTVGIFKFKARFKNANTLVTVTVHEIEESVKVHGFHIDPIGEISAPSEFKA